MDFFKLTCPRCPVAPWHHALGNKSTLLRAEIIHVQARGPLVILPNRSYCTGGPEMRLLAPPAALERSFSCDSQNQHFPFRVSLHARAAQSGAMHVSLSLKRVVLWLISLLGNPEFLCKLQCPALLGSPPLYTNVIKSTLLRYSTPAVAPGPFLLQRTNLLMLSWEKLSPLCG